MRYLYLLAGLLLGGWPGSALAQSVLPLPGDRPVRPVLLKTGLTSLIGPDATLLAGIELPVGNHKAWQIEGSYGWFNSLIDFDRSRYNHQSVYTVRSEFRWYGYGDFPPGVVSASRGPYFAVELVGKQINVRDEATVGRDCVGFTCGYFEKISQPVTRYITSGFIKGGWQLPVGPRGTATRFVTDLYVGIGIGNGWTTRVPLPANGSAGTDLYYNNTNFLEPKDRFAAGYRHASIDFMAGLKLGYQLRPRDDRKK